MRATSGQAAWDDDGTVRAFEESGLTFYALEDGPRPVWLGALTRHQADGEHRSSYGGLAHGRRGGDVEVLVLTGTPGALDASSALALVVGRRAVDADRREPAVRTVRVDGVATVLRGTTGAAGTAVGAPLPDGHELWVATRGGDLEGAALVAVTDLRPAGRARAEELVRVRDERSAEGGRDALDPW